MSRLAPIPGARPSSSRWRIPESERERVFERFYRVLGSGEDGSGLGLPIVREIAELHRGSVSLEPNPAGAGTLARVVFPRRATARVEMQPSIEAFPLA